jgi:hypothetical protein
MPSTVSRFLDVQFSHTDPFLVRRHVELRELRKWPKLAADADSDQDNCGWQNSVANNPACTNCDHHKCSFCTEEYTLVG